MASARSKSFWLLTILIALPGTSAVTKRKATVRIRNEFGEPIYGVRVIHKYSNNYVDQFSWDAVKNGETSSAKGDARYHTGFLTTGRDWWKVIWAAKSGMYNTHPNNFRDIIDFMEKAWDKIDGYVIVAASAALTVATGGGAAPSMGAAVAATVMTKAAVDVSDSLTAPGSTVGFKQHILRKSDQDRPLTITIRRHEVVFESRSGISTTNGIKRKALPKTEPKPATNVKPLSKPKPPKSTGKISWQQGDWAFACDFRGNDIGNARIPGEQCGAACARNPDCTHFTWTNHQGGTCWMKGGRASKSTAFFTNNKSMVCGIAGSKGSSGTSSSSGISWQQGDWAFACDFRGNDIGNARIPGEQCGAACARNPDCTHFTWTNHQGGTCWMKGGRASKSTAFFTNNKSMVCGVTSKG